MRIRLLKCVPTGTLIVRKSRSSPGIVADTTLLPRVRLIAVGVAGRVDRSPLTVSSQTVAAGATLGARASRAVAIRAIGRKFIRWCNTRVVADDLVHDSQLPPSKKAGSCRGAEDAERNKTRRNTNHR